MDVIIGIGVAVGVGIVIGHVLYLYLLVYYIFLNFMFLSFLICKLGIMTVSTCFIFSAFRELIHIQCLKEFLAYKRAT